jgi:hypothetical protein
MLRPLVHFFLIGALLFAGKTVFEARPGVLPEITVYVPIDATEAQVEREIENQILLNEARRYGWYRTDPIVFTHLVRNMRFIEPETTDNDLTLFKRALQMNMQEHDPVVRARLLYRAREALGYVPKDRMPTEQDLETHRTAHGDRFEREGKMHFEHVFLSRTKRGDALEADAVAMGAQLEALGGAPPKGLGDPLPGLRMVQSSTASEVKANYGIELAAVVAEGVVGSWRGPIPSVYGQHFVRVLEREPTSVPALAMIAPEVRADLLSEIKEELRKERMNALRDAYVVHVERIP